MTDKTAPQVPSNDLTEIAVVLDRSGSMSAIQDDMEGGLWATITEQNGLPGRCRVSLYQFDTEWEAVFEAKPSGDICQDDCRLVPRGRTALNDAVVKSIASMEDRVLKEPEDQRPAIVVVVVITDGRENSSRENSRADANAAIARVEEKYGWDFIFLAAGKDDFEDGAQMMAGTRGVGMAYDKGNVRGMSQVYSTAIGRRRTGAQLDLNAESGSGNSDDSSDGGPKVH